MIPNALKIFGENIISPLSNITVSSGDATKTNLIDQRPDTVWLSSGSNDTTTEIVATEFANKIGYIAPAHFDRIILLNHNIKSMSADYVYGTTTTDIPEATISDNAEDNLIIELAAPVYADQVRLSALTTMEANVDKQIGELKLCKYVLTLDALSNFERTDWRRGGTYRTRSGSLVRWNEAERVEGNFTIENITQTQRDAIYQATKDYDFLTFVLYDNFDPAAVYEFAIVNPPIETFDRKTRLYSITLQVKER